MKTFESDISYAQRFLHLTPTGILDELTEAAIRNFQLKNKIPFTGELDKLTWTTMFGTEIKINTDSDIKK